MRCSTMPPPKNSANTIAIAASTFVTETRGSQSTSCTATRETTAEPRISTQLLRPSIPKDAAMMKASITPPMEEWETTSARRVRFRR